MSLLRTASSTVPQKGSAAPLPLAEVAVLAPVRHDTVDEA